MPLPDKEEAIMNISVPTTRKQLRSFIGLINYYKDMWQHGFGILTFLLDMTPK